MKIIDLEGNQINWSPKSIVSNPSLLHIRAMDILKELFPMCQIMSEVIIPTKPFHSQYLDLYIPLLRLGIEVQGIQHYRYTPFFQKEKLYWYMQKKRDREKKEWCVLNKIILIELPYDEEKEWKTIIQKYVQ